MWVRETLQNISKLRIKKNVKRKPRQKHTSYWFDKTDTPSFHSTFSRNLKNLIMQFIEYLYRKFTRFEKY